MTLNLALRLGAGLAEFTPASISGLQLWLDASDAASFTFSSGNVVSQWNDKSGNGRHASQGTVANQPTRSGASNGVVADGTNDFVNNTGVSVMAQPITIAAVVKRPASGAMEVITGQNGSGVGFEVTATGVVETVKVATAGLHTSSGTISTTGYHQITTTVSASSAAIWINGASSGSSAHAQSLSGTGGYAIFAQYANGAGPRAGEVAEVIVYNSVLGTTDRQAVESYLKTKWGTP